MGSRTRDCEWCGFGFPIKNSRARFCSDAHRAAAARARATEAALLAEQGQQPTPEPVTPSPSAVLDGEALQQLVAAVAAQLGNPAALPADDEPPGTPREPTYGPQETAVRAQLAAAGRLSTAMGQAAVVLAFRIDNSQGETLSALAAGTKALQERLTAALIGTALGAPGASPVIPTGEDEDGDESEASTGERVSHMEDGRRRRESRRFGA